MDIGTDPPCVDKPDCRCLWLVFLRTLSLQGSWNTQRMQNLGLVYALLPWLRQAKLPVREARQFCRRHYEYFNTNPYYANLLIGGLLRLEEENRRADGAMLKVVRNFKDSLGRALASLGDQFVWLGLQPALLVVASLAGGRFLLGSPGAAGRVHVGPARGTLPGSDLGLRSGPGDRRSSGVTAVASSHLDRETRRRPVHGCSGGTLCGQIGSLAARGRGAFVAVGHRPGPWFVDDGTKTLARRKHAPVAAATCRSADLSVDFRFRVDSRITVQ